MKLGEVIRKWRVMSELSVREAAMQIGLAPATLARIESGDSMGGDSLAAVLRWLMSIPVHDVSVPKDTASE